MLRRTTLAAASLVLGALVAAGSAGATPSQPVTITVDTSFVPGAVDEFSSTGGVVCAAGEVSTPAGLFVGDRSGFKAQILVLKHFVCPDGTFDALLRVTLDFATGDTEGTWSIVGGTGAYRHLHGGGTIAGDGMGTHILDEYTGGLAIE